MRFALLALVLLATGCGEKVNVSVHCITTAAPAVECDVKQTKGKSEVEVCWDFKATCANGAVVTAERTCQKVKDGATVKTTIPADKLDGVDKCAGDKPPVAVMENMTIDGKKAQ
jgi:hypothetical protein